VPSLSAGWLTAEPMGTRKSISLPLVPATAQVGVFEGTALIAGQRYHAGWLRLSGGDQRGAATYFPSSLVRGSIVIALLPEYPTGPI